MSWVAGASKRRTMNKLYAQSLWQLLAPSRSPRPFDVEPGLGAGRQHFLIMFVLLLALLPYRVALAIEQQSDTPMDVTAGGPYASEQAGQQGAGELGGVPALFRTPETGLGGGAVLVYVPAVPLGAKVSSALGGMLYTEKHQFLTGLYVEHYFGNDRWAAELYLARQDYPDSFFGVGNATLWSDEEHYAWRQAKMASSLRYLFTPDFRAGLCLGAEANHFDDFERGGQLDSGAIYGAQGGKNAAVGLTMRYDTTDDAYAPRRGQVLNASYLRYAPSLGGDFDFATTDINAKTFHALAANDVLATQIYLGSGSGRMPFFNLFQLGGKNLLRGYYYGRYRDRNMLVAQTEWRHQIKGPAGMVVFAGLGDVTEEFKQIAGVQPKMAAGFGLRYQLVERTKINLRLDFAFARGERNPSVYLYILEAF